MRFYKTCTSAVSESEFDHANRIGRFAVAEQTVKLTAQLCCPQTCKRLGEDNSDAPKPLHFLTEPICSRPKLFSLHLTESTQIDLLFLFQSGTRPP